MDSVHSSIQLPVFPAELSQLPETIVTISLNKPLGMAARVIATEAAKTLLSYHLAVSCSASGKDLRTQAPIAVNTLGRWLYGVPGYDGHIRIVADGNDVHLCYPEHAPREVHSHIQELQAALTA